MCGETDFKLLIENPNSHKIVGLMCGNIECKTTVMFDDEDQVIFDKS